MKKQLNKLRAVQKIADLLFEDLSRIHYQIALVAKISAGQKAPLISPNFSHLFSQRREHCVNVLEIGFVGSVFCLECSRGAQAT